MTNLIGIDIILCASSPSLGTGFFLQYKIQRGAEEKEFSVKVEYSKPIKLDAIEQLKK